MTVPNSLFLRGDMMTQETLRMVILYFRRQSWVVLEYALHFVIQFWLAGVQLMLSEKELK